MEIGSKGLEEANLTIPQGTSLTFSIEHTDGEGHTVDHSQSTFKMAFESKDGSRFVDLSECASGGASSVTVSIPASVSSALPIGKMLWDIIATMSSGESVRLLYGTVTIVDTYALDGEQDGD